MLGPLQVLSTYYANFPARVGPVRIDLDAQGNAVLAWKGDGDSTPVQTRRRLAGGPLGTLATVAADESVVHDIAVAPSGAATVLYSEGGR